MQEKISSLSAYVSGRAFALFGAFSLQDWMSIVGGGGGAWCLPC
ncbi:HP1 family phage holin [Aliivibrio fischeri]|nr:HP1 family phage holin [Aliivibrio fischeri]